MMKLRYILTLIVTLLLIKSEMFAQSYTESALTFARTRPGGSARIQALGGSQIALGGDYSSAFSNPAGLGMFNRSEFSITPGLGSFTTDANYLGNATSETSSRFQIPGLGLVMHVPGELQEGSSFIGGSFGISFNRTNDFGRSIRYMGNNPDNSIVEYFIDQANGATTEQFAEPSGNLPAGPNYNTPIGLAYYNYLIGPASTLDPANPDDEYFTDVQSNFEDILSNPDQLEEIETQGATNQWSFAYGANFSDKIFVGGGIGIGTLKYETTRAFSESYAIDPNFTELRLEENLNISGLGINATLGVIARPVNFLQIGFSYATPTHYQISEEYEANMTTNWKNFDYFGDGKEILTNEYAGTDLVTSEYSITIPSKISTGVAFISKFGFITGDVEFTNPGRARYSSDTDGISFGSDNDDIRATYRSVVNYRIGAEYRYEIFRVRAGYGLQANTYKSEIELDNKITSISGGVGVRLKKFYVDFALIHRKGEKYYYQPYTFSNGTGPVADFRNKDITGMLTIGFNY